MSAPTDVEIRAFLDGLSPTHRCCCVLVTPDDDGAPGRCKNVALRDEPFCSDCDDRHPGFVAAGCTVSAVL